MNLKRSVRSVREVEEGRDNGGSDVILITKEITLKINPVKEKVYTALL